MPYNPIPTYPDPERFFDKVDTSGSCWMWRGYTVMGRTHRYGQFTIGRKSQLAHRYVYELLIGPIPEGFQVDHLCFQTLCVRPSHLEAVTPQVNTLRSNGITAKNARKEACKRGHLFDEANTYMSRDGKRVCRTCKNAYGRRGEILAKIEAARTQ